MAHSVLRVYKSWFNTRVQLGSAAYFVVLVFIGVYAVDNHSQHPYVAILFGAIVLLLWMLSLQQPSPTPPIRGDKDNYHFFERHRQDDDI